MKKLLQQLQELIDTYGYWSEEVRKFNTKLDYTTMMKINQLCKK